MNGVRKLWGGGSSSTTPSTLPSSEGSPLTTTPGLFIKKNKKQSSLASITDAGNGNDVNGSDRSISPASSRVTSPLRKPVPTPTPTPVPGPSSPRILPPLQPRTSTASGWKRTSGLLNIRDDLLMSLLTSEAVVESRECEILSGEEVEELKKEQQILKIRVTAAQRKLKLETKIRDAALSLSKVNTAHKRVSKATDDQLDAAERRVNTAQMELWRVSERANEVERKLLEHRAGVLGFSVSKMERKMMPSGDASGMNTPSRSSVSSPVATTSPPPRARFDGAHLFAGHADAANTQSPTIPSRTRNKPEMARELSHLRLEKEQVETTMGMELQTAEETVAALEQEFPRLEELNAKCQELLEERAQWEKDKTQLAAREKEVERAGEATEMERALSDVQAQCDAELQKKDEEIAALKAEWEDAKEEWEAEKALHGIQTSPDTSLQGLLASVASHLETLSAALQGHSDRHARFGDELRVHMEENETLLKDLDAVRLERDNAQLEVQSLESRVKELSDASSTPSEPPVEYTGEAADIIAILQPIWNILPAPELRAAKLSSKRHLRNPSMISNPGRSSPLPSPSKSTLSDTDVRALKTLYDVRPQLPPTPTSATSPSPQKQSRGTFSVEAFVSRVQALIIDDRALIERLIRFAQAHDLLKKNAERAQKLAQESNTALETYQRQVSTLERQNTSLVSKQNALYVKLQDAIERAVCEAREMEMHAADQAETSASAPEKVRKQLEGQLTECTEALRQATEEINDMRMSEQTQRIALLDELNSVQTENGNLRAQLRAKR
ncbi:Up-regulated during septation-domain-containing protein [Suillus bovinus]|uniref:Up-regulated during septation-domain-containing protein n=1 Tax=Suillus bovinus TaxID=48563 RepID=UPI001B85DFB2|nr:Up-regulated during septation-domain-containing protein [Suillus bovinus]KAG2135707.1 Up-regulated during septation-domain-containing protein [Suillus bovinus]